jgi:hypothetical protein
LQCVDETHSVTKAPLGGALYARKFFI